MWSLSKPPISYDVATWLGIAWSLALILGGGLNTLGMIAARYRFEWFGSWLLVAATVVGISRTVFAIMPGAWKTLGRSTDPGARHLSRNVQAAQGDAPVTGRRARRDTDA